MHLHTALRRREVEQARPRVLTSLELELEPAGHLAELASTLEGAYIRVLDGLGGNTSVQFVGGRLQLERLGPLAEPHAVGRWPPDRPEARARPGLPPAAMPPPDVPSYAAP